MNSNYGKSNRSASLNSFNFDLGINSNRSRSLNHRNSTFGSTQSRPNMMSSATPSWQPNKPSWTHQPAPRESGLPGSLSGPTSMVGDIFGKNWNSSNTSSTASNIGSANKNPSLFGDLLSSAMGQNKGSSGNVPLKNAAPISNKSGYSMGGMADSLPKTGNAVKSSRTWGFNGSSGSYTSAYNSNSNVSVSNTNKKGPILGGQPMCSFGGSGSVGGAGMSSNKDPFGSLVDFGSKPANCMNSYSKGDNKTSSDDNVFGDFQKPDSSMYSSTGGYNKTNSDDNIFGDFKKPGSSMYSSTKGSYNTSLDNNVFGDFQNTSKSTSVESSGVDAFDSLFSSNSSTVGHDIKRSEGSGVEQFSGADDWGYSSEFGGGDDSSVTIELEGLPPPPAGVTSSVAKNKGMDNQKQGQYADAIKWLSWAVVLFEKSGDNAGTMEVLSCRSSCYKEIGEYKKAVADCTKVLENDGENISVLVQRALLYESMEKYKLGAEDLRTVMKLDPCNRVARSTIHRLTKMTG